MIESNREIKKPSEKREIMPRFEASALRGYCVSVLTASGVERSCAEAVADALIDAELTGVSTHGVSRLAVYMQRMDAGVMSRENNIRSKDSVFGYHFPLTLESVPVVASL